MACFGIIADYNPEFIWSSGTASVSWCLHSVQYRCKSVCFLVHCKAEPSRHLNPLTLASLSCFPSSSTTLFPCLCLCNCQCSFSVFFFILLIYLFIYFFFFWAVKLIIPSAWGDFSTSTWSIRPTTGCRSRSTPLRVRRNLFWQLSRDGNLHASGLSHAEWTEAWDSHKHQIPGLSYNWWGFQVWDTLQDSTGNSSIDKAETSLDW